MLRTIVNRFIGYKPRTITTLRMLEKEESNNLATNGPGSLSILLNSPRAQFFAALLETDFIQAILAPSPPYLDITTELSRLPEAATRHNSTNFHSSRLKLSCFFSSSNSSCTRFSVRNCHAKAIDFADVTSVRSTFISTWTRLIIDVALPA